MNRICRATLLVGLALGLIACGSSQPVRFYSLDPLLEAENELDTADSLVLGIGPLRIPEYASRSRIAVRGSGSEVIVDDFNRWIEPVDEAIHRIIATNVDSLLENVIVVSFPYGYYRELPHQVIGRIERFDAHRSGRTVLMVQWTVMTGDHEVVVLPRRSRYEAQASNPDDYGSIARALSETVAAFSRDIAREFEAAVR